MSPRRGAWQASGPVAPPGTQIESAHLAFTAAGTDTGPAVFTIRADNDSPRVEAEATQMVAEGTLVTLTLLAAIDPEGQPLTYAWTQTAGPSVVLSSASAVAPTFTAPDLLADATLTFEVTVSDGITPSTDSVSILVTAAP